jgi:SAM-dependent methyltransferase
MDYTGEIAAIQQRLARSRELGQRRHAVIAELGPRRGERILDVGCGAGLLLREIALVTGPHGLAAGVDISADQIAAAALECDAVPGVVRQVGDVHALPWPDAVFDAAIAVQVIEHLDDAPHALAEIGRVLKPGGRFLCLATNWASAFWHGPEEALTAEISAAWEDHCVHPNLPARLPPMLARAGFSAIRQIPLPVVNPDLHDNTFAHGIARLMAAQAVASGVPQAQAVAWLDALDRAEAVGEFFFSVVPILTHATAS